jgi:hypothetical protein
MASAFQTIVEIYVRDRNSKAIQESLNHRRSLTGDLQLISNGHHVALLTELAQEIALLEAALKRLEEPTKEAAIQNPHQASTQDHSKHVDLDGTPPDTDQHAPKARFETPASSKQVEILLVDISKAPTVEPAPSAAYRATPVQIIGITVAASSSDDDDQGFE